MLTPLKRHVAMLMRDISPLCRCHAAAHALRVAALRAAVDIAAYKYATDMIARDMRRCAFMPRSTA